MNLLWYCSLILCVSCCCTYKAVATLSNDTNVIVFGDIRYKVQLHLFNPDEENEERYNATLCLICSDKGKDTILSIDSLYCRLLELHCKDYNNDGIPDLKIFYTTGTRGSNEMYYLFLADKKHHRLYRVEHFENLVNPVFDTTLKMICCTAYAGTVYYSFYRINAYHKLVHYDYDFEAAVEDQHRYDAQMARIRKRR